jgi:hypothetical protein
MSAERLPDESELRVPNLPPFNAWLFPEHWLSGHDGRIKITAPRVQPPVDENGFVKVDELMDEILGSVFRHDYDWAFDADDQTTWPAYFRFFQGQYRLMPGQMRNALLGILARAPSEGIEPPIRGFEAIRAEIDVAEQEAFLAAHFSGYIQKMGASAIDFERPLDESFETITANVAEESGNTRRLISIEALRRSVALQREDSKYFEHLSAA